MELNSKECSYVILLQYYDSGKLLVHKGQMVKVEADICNLA